MFTKTVALLALASLGLATECPEHFSFDGTQNCYSGLTGPYFYSEVTSHCKAMGGQMAEIHSDSEFQHISQYMERGRRYYLNGQQSFGSYVWSDGSIIEKKYWLPGEPNANNGNCVVFDNSANATGLRAADCINLDYYRGVMCSLKYEKKCGGGSVDGPQGTVTSDNYPNGYSNNLNCSTVINSNLPNGVVNLVFTDFQVESPWDYVTLFNGPSTGSPYIEKIIAASQNKTATSSAQSMTILFTTDYDGTDKGWSADYFTGVASTPERYGGEGGLTSPYYGQSYGRNNLAQFYYFENLKYQQYSFKFHSFETQSADGLYIYTGNPPRLAAKYSGTPSVPFTFTTADNDVMMVYNTGESGQSYGWNMTFSSFYP